MDKNQSNIFKDLPNSLLKIQAPRWTLLEEETRHPNAPNGGANRTDLRWSQESMLCFMSMKKSYPRVSRGVVGLVFEVLTFLTPGWGAFLQLRSSLTNNAFARSGVRTSEKAPAPGNFVAASRQVLQRANSQCKPQVTNWLLNFQPG